MKYTLTTQSDAFQFVQRYRNILAGYHVLITNSSKILALK